MALPLLLSLLAATASAATYNNSTLCLGPYALCASATCMTLPSNTTHVACTCAGPFQGLNLGSKTTCQDRTTHLTSTYSLTNPYSSPDRPMAPIPPVTFPDNRPANSNGPKLYAIPCEGANTSPWASCPDAPCSRSRNGSVSCTCPLQASSSNFYYGTKCPSSQDELHRLCTGGVRSASALPKGATAETLPGLVVGSTLGAFYGADVPVIHSCVVPQ